MKVIKATTAPTAEPALAPLLFVSGGAGNGDRVQVHLSIRDPFHGDQPISGWFALSDLEAALTEARFDSLRAQFPKKGQK